MKDFVLFCINKMFNERFCINKRFCFLFLPFLPSLRSGLSPGVTSWIQKNKVVNYVHSVID